MQRARRSQVKQPASDDSSREGSSSDEADDEHTLAVQEQGRIITRTAFDSYFVQAAATARTSTHIFSDLIPPLQPGEYASAIRTAKPLLKTIQPPVWSGASCKTLFSQFVMELQEGFNLIFYGFGSKRRVLNYFAADYCAKHGHVVVLNGFQPDFTFKDLVTSAEKIPGMSTAPLPYSGIEGQVRRINHFFAQSSQRERLYIVVHNVDAPAFRAARTKHFLSLLATNPRIHLVASVDHLNAPLLWSSSESCSRKSDQGSDQSTASHGFAWLWHDMTTLASYDFELSFADRSSIAGASAIHTSAARKLREGGPTGSAMTETAALHILASVTQRAKKLFALIARLQLEKVEQANDPGHDPRQYSFSYDTLFSAALSDHIATDDMVFRALFGEFRDHGLVASVQGVGGIEALYIPLRKERLASVLASVTTG